MALTEQDAYILGLAFQQPEYALLPPDHEGEAYEWGGQLYDPDYQWNGFVRDPNVGVGAITGWFFGGAAGNAGLTPLLLQWKFAHALQRNIIVSAGIGASKTAGVGMGSTHFCLTTRYFKFVNTAPTAGQADLVFYWLVERIDANPALARYVVDIVKKPYPKITWLTKATMEFRTAGLGGVNLRGIEADWINGDEAAFIPRFKETHTALTGRLRGTRPDNTLRLGRLSYVTSPEDNDEFWELWDMGADPTHPGYAPDKYLCLRSSIYDNFYLSPEHVEAIVESIPPERRAVELEGARPIGMGAVFPRPQVDAIQDLDLNYVAEGVRITSDGITSHEERIAPPEGYEIMTDHRAGVYRYVKPPQQGHLYVLGGDPGTGDPPYRNAGVVFVWDVTTKPYEIVYFHWVKGGGFIAPFVQSYRNAMDLYNPLYQGIDATGPQQYLNELLNEQFADLLGEDGEIEGIKFNRDKRGMISALQHIIQRGWLKGPAIKGMSSQLKSYVVPDKDIAQDIVCGMMVCAWLARSADASYNITHEAVRRDSRAAVSHRRTYESYSSVRRSR